MSCPRTQHSYAGEALIAYIVPVITELLNGTGLGVFPFFESKLLSVSTLLLNVCNVYLCLYLSFKKSIIRKYHDHIPQTIQRHCGEETKQRQLHDQKNIIK